jgi:hypothetical protein
MRSYHVRGAAIVAVVALVVGGTAGVSWAKGHKKVKPTITSSLSSSSIALGTTTVDTATVTGAAAHGSPTGSVTFGVCGPTSVATKCTSPNDGSAIVGLSTGANNRSTASVTIDPSTTGWYCLRDKYSGDSHYKTVTDNATASECLDVTSGGGGGPYTPTLKSALSPSTTTVNGSSVDTATVTGNATAGSPTGSVSFYVCGPTAVATACTSPNIGPATIELTQESGNRSIADVTIEDFTSTGWYCFLDEYSGDGNYNPVNDNDTATECLDVTGGGGQTYTPTMKSSLSPTTIAAGGSSVDTATVTGNATAGSPTGYVSFYVCGPTAVATACTSPNLGPADVELTSESGNRSTANVTIQANGSGWYCFLDEYSGDGSYKPVSDNDTATECLDVTGTSSDSRSGASATLTPPPGATARHDASKRGAVLRTP